jgi:hypothetical protein
MFRAAGQDQLIQLKPRPWLPTLLTGADTLPLCPANHAIHGRGEADHREAESPKFLFDDSWGIGILVRCWLRRNQSL